MLELEKHLENPMDPERVRFLEGSDLKPADLHVKLEEVGGANMRDGACVHQVAYGLCVFVFRSARLSILHVCMRLAVGSAPSGKRRVTAGEGSDLRASDTLVRPRQE